MIRTPAMPQMPQLVRVFDYGMPRYTTIVPYLDSFTGEIRERLEIYWETTDKWHWELIADPREIAYFRSLADNE